MGGGDLDDGLEEAIERLLEGLAALEASLGGQEEDLTIDPPLPDLVALSHRPHSRAGFERSTDGFGGATR